MLLYHIIRSFLLQKLPRCCMILAPHVSHTSTSFRGTSDNSSCCWTTAGVSTALCGTISAARENNRTVPAQENDMILTNNELFKYLPQPRCRYIKQPILQKCDLLKVRDDTISIPHAAAAAAVAFRQPRRSCQQRS